MHVWWLVADRSKKSQHGQESPRSIYDTVGTGMPGGECVGISRFFLAFVSGRHVLLLLKPASPRRGFQHPGCLLYRVAVWARRTCRRGEVCGGELLLVLPEDARGGWDSGARAAAVWL